MTIRLGPLAGWFSQLIWLLKHFQFQEVANDLCKAPAQRSAPGGVRRPLLALAALAVLSFPAQSQTVLEEVLVTATRRDTDLQTTPISVSAIDSALIEQANPRDLGDLAVFVPNFSAARVTSFANAASFGLRGVGQNNIIVYYEPPVSVVLDDFALTSVQTQLLDTFDLSQVEVLRGPQGTLFGKNTTRRRHLGAHQAPLPRRLQRRLGGRLRQLRHLHGQGGGERALGDGPTGAAGGWRLPQVRRVRPQRRRLRPHRPATGAHQVQRPERHGRGRAHRRLRHPQRPRQAAVGAGGQLQRPAPI